MISSLYIYIQQFICGTKSFEGWFLSINYIDKKSDVFPFIHFSCNLLFIGNAAGISTFLTW